VTFGKPLFVPRQQVLDFRYANPDADVWAAAATFDNPITGHMPRDFPRGKDSLAGDYLAQLAETDEQARAEAAEHLLRTLRELSRPMGGKP
jgi:hypothetical protein